MNSRIGSNRRYEALFMQTYGMDLPESARSRAAAVHQPEEVIDATVVRRAASGWLCIVPQWFGFHQATIP